MIIKISHDITYVCAVLFLYSLPIHYATCHNSVIQCSAISILIPILILIEYINTILIGRN